LDPERPEPFINLALMHEEHAKQLSDAGDEAQAEKEDELAHKYYQHLLAAKQAFPPAYYHAAFFFLRKHNYDRTVSLLTSYIGMNDDEERTNKAKSILEKLSSMGYLDTLFKEAYDFIQMGEEQKGLERAKQFVDKFPSVWNGWFLVGWAHRRLGIGLKEPKLLPLRSRKVPKVRMCSMNLLFARWKWATSRLPGRISSGHCASSQKMSRSS
jgi:tetratricopeptide (TPR) repeat protein